MFSLIKVFESCPNDKVLFLRAQIESFYLGEGADAPYNLHGNFQATRFSPQDRTLSFGHILWIFERYRNFPQISVGYPQDILG